LSDGGKMMDIEAELVWLEELSRRQEAHIVEVWRLRTPGRASCP